MSTPPLYRDTFALCEWVLGRLRGDAGPLARRISDTALSLLEAVSLALKGRRRREQLALADEWLICLRGQLRLANASGVLTAEQLEFAFERAETIGRQLGGWMRSIADS